MKHAKNWGKSTFSHGFISSKIACNYFFSVMLSNQYPNSFKVFSLQNPTVLQFRFSTRIEHIRFSVKRNQIKIRKSRAIHIKNMLPFSIFVRKNVLCMCEHVLIGTPAVDSIVEPNNKGFIQSSWTAHTHAGNCDVKSTST